jgi:hypothetical protein
MHACVCAHDALHSWYRIVHETAKHKTGPDTNQSVAMHQLPTVKHIQAFMRMHARYRAADSTIAINIHLRDGAGVVGCYSTCSMLAV